MGLLIRVGFAVVSAMGLENVEENATDDDGPLYFRFCTSAALLINCPVT